ncbi:protein tramtrack, beta isoform-like isoform X7 [Bacillus rossius redtenbacheri]|uniref:protein tramtrack, beta isoform-like isoform X7 n=1 Tax=Bacillus rossius redtenbacheri TaxID=93214 RepID=UPI002FDD3C54
MSKCVYRKEDISRAKTMEAKSEQFSLRWDNFHSNLSTSFHSLLQGEELVDVTLAADGRFIQAHKLVLSVCSPYFKSLFKANPCQHPIVILKDVGHKELVDVLQFMYRGEVSVGQEDLAEFLKTAELLQVKGLAGDDADAPEGSKEQKTAIKDAPSELPPISQRSKIKTPLRSPANVVASPLSSAPKTPIKTETAPNQEFAQQPPQKRRCHEQPQYSPQGHSPPLPQATLPQMCMTTCKSVSSVSDSSREVEFVSLPNPKEEPVEIDSDIEEVDTTFDNGTDLSEFLEGQSSQLFQNFQEMGLPDGQCGPSQDIGILQEGEQGGSRVVRRYRRRPRVVHGG